MSGHGGCDCHPCRMRNAAAALGLTAPFGAKDWRRIEEAAGVSAFTGPPAVDLGVDQVPAVAKARSGVEAALGRFGPADDAWGEAVEELRDAELLAHSIDEFVSAKARGSLPRLRERLREAGDERDRRWAAVVKARGQEADARRRAVVDLVDRGALKTRSAAVKTSEASRAGGLPGHAVAPVDGGPDRTGTPAMPASVVPPVDGGPDHVGGRRAR